MTDTMSVQKKYKTETGESMEKPSEKLKKIASIVGITGAVYVSLKYLLPLVVPFLVGYGIALFLKEPVMRVHENVYWVWKGKKYYFPIAVAAMLLLIWMIGLIGAICYLGGCKLLEEIQHLSIEFPIILETLDRELMRICCKIEEVFHIKSGVIPILVRESILDAISYARKEVMPYLVGNSMILFQRTVQIVAVIFVTLMAAILSLQEMEDLRKKREQSLFRQEFALIGSRVVRVGKAYVKTQGIIMAGTAFVCSVGLFLMKNPYYLLLGVVIGIVDALPIFGTGTIFVPWILVSILQKDWKMAGGLLFIYGICYALREILETKWMGNEVGLTPLETLISMYVGLLLFGIWGFLLGPVGLLLIEDFLDMIGNSMEYEK